MMPDRIHHSDWSKAFIILLLSAFLLVRGILPALTRLDTDFPNYYTAGRIVLERNGIERLYDDGWFQEQIDRNGIQQAGKFSPFPPVTALVCAPLALFSPLDALRMTTAANLGLLAVALVLLARLAGTGIWDSLIFVLLSGHGLANNFRFGQMYIAVSLSIISGYYLAARGRPVLAGVALGLMTPVKYFPLIVLIYFALRKDWKVVAAGAITSVAIVAVSIAVMGWDIHSQYLRTVLGSHLSGHLTLQDPYSSTFQSFDSFFRRLFVRDDALNPSPLIDSNALYSGLKAGVIAGVLLLLWGAIRAMKSASTQGSERNAFSLLCIGGLLLAPATASYHFLILWLACGFLLAETAARPELRGVYWVILVSYAAVGFSPYNLLSRFDGRGLLTLLAYPRLLMTVLLFLAAAFAALRPARPMSALVSETQEL